MNVWDILILLAVAALVLLALRAVHGGRSGGCHDCGSASCCAQSCEHCHKGCADKKSANGM